MYIKPPRLGPTGIVAPAAAVLSLKIFFAVALLAVALLVARWVLLRGVEKDVH